MADGSTTKNVLEEEIQEVIRTNQILLRKKGLLKRLLDDEAIQHLLKHVLNSEDKLLSEEEKKLLQDLKKNGFNLDKTIEKMVEDAANEMKGDLINDINDQVADIENTPQPGENNQDEEPSRDLKRMPDSSLSEDDVEQALETREAPGRLQEVGSDKEEWKSVAAVAKNTKYHEVPGG
jgi:hypothetical protein